MYSVYFMNDFQPPSSTELSYASSLLGKLADELNNVLFGQEELIRLTITGVLARGHILLEGLPGLGKTELVKGLSHALGIQSRRVQFTPDLLPGDITGNPVLQEVDGKRQFVFQQGPAFTNILLADEINRASPKTQSALLEAMQERSITVAGTTYPLPEPFFVLATQNPIDLEGTYPLPEAQLDRFLFKILVTRNPADVLTKIVLNRDMGVEPKVNQILDGEQLLSLMELARRIRMPEAVANYIGRIVNSTHNGESSAAQGVRFGASPRAALALASASKARALLFGRSNASFEDVQALLHPVLGHRILLDHMTRLEGITTANVIDGILKEVPAQERPLPDSLAAAKIH